MDANIADDSQAPERPSFTAFWKRTKDAASTAAKQVTFVPGSAISRGKGRRRKADEAADPSKDQNDDADDDEGEMTEKPSDDGGGGTEGLTKAQIRRAQVRRAQAQHRQRKADYLEQLEVDVNTLRDLIAAAERETRTLRQDNDAIRVRLGLTFDGDGMGTMYVQGVAPPGGFSTEAMGAPQQTDSLFSDIDLDDLHVSLVMDEVMGTPVFQIASPGSSASPPPRLLPVSPAQNTPTPVSPATASGDAVLPAMTLSEAHQAINFILAYVRPPEDVWPLTDRLEYVCWDHAGHQFHAPSLGHCADKGHALMATNLLLRSAPPAVFGAMETVAHEVGTLLVDKQVATEGPPDLTSPELARNGHLSWQAPALALGPLAGGLPGLQGLSESLAAQGGEEELAPVQAWFELAAAYPMAVLLRPDVLDELKRSLKGVVKCLYYGAVMERSQFQEVAHRVLDPLVMVM